MIVFDVKDQRVKGTAPVYVDLSTLDKIAEEVDFPKLESPIEIRIRLRDLKDDGYVGHVTTVAPFVYRLVICLLPKTKFSAKAQYVLNNTLIHEMRHVAQFETYGVIATAMMQNEMEDEAQEYGRKARPSRLGSKVWALAGASF